MHFADVVALIPLHLFSQNHFGPETKAECPRNNRRVTVRIENLQSSSGNVTLFSLNEGNPYETLFSLIGKAVTPYFKSFIKESGRGERDGDKLAPTVEKNLNEAEVDDLMLLI